MCFYLFVEYVRPQQLIGAIAGTPLGQISLGAATIAYFGTGAPGFGMKGVGSWLLLAFTTVIIVSSITAYDPSISFTALRVWISWVVIYFLIINVVDTEQRFAFFVTIWLLCHIYMAQGGARQFAGRGFRFASWGVIGAPGWFQNSGEFGIAMGMLVPMSWHYYQAAKEYLTKWRRILLLSVPALAILCVIGSSSRGCLLGLVATMLVLFLRSKINIKTIVGVVAVAVAIWVIIPAEQKARFTTAGSDGTSTTRLMYWQSGLEMANTHPAFGIGYENWLRFYSAFYPESESADRLGVHSVEVSHNIFIQCMAELGYIGLATFVLLIGATLLINLRTRRLARAERGPPRKLIMEMACALDEAMICYLVAGFFVTVLYYPFFWINLALSVSLNAIARRGSARPVHSRRMVSSANDGRSNVLNSRLVGTVPRARRH